MTALQQLFTVSVLLFMVDLIWLTGIGENYRSIVQIIQGGEMVRMRPLAAFIVYPALAFLALRTKSLKDSFLTGSAVYAVYDFTVLAIFNKYPLYMAVADTLWGGILFTATYWIRERFGL